MVGFGGVAFFLLCWTFFNTFLGKCIAELFYLRAIIGEIKQSSVIAHRKQQLNESHGHPSPCFRAGKNAANLYDSMLSF